jgi:Bacterial Ig-like domain
MRPRKNSSRCINVFDYLEARQLLALILTGNNITATTETPFSGAVASLIDTNLLAKPSGFNTPPGSVTISWGDGDTTSGTVVGTLIPGFFEVDGTHQYASGGSFATQIAVKDQSGNSATGSGSAAVAIAQLTIAGNAISGIAGVPPQVPPVVATFLDTNLADTSSDFNALIKWGDGQASAGTVSGGHGVFTVIGSNTYAAAGTYATTIIVVGVGGAPSASTTGTAAIGSVSPIVLSGQSIVAVTGQSLSNATVATFTDSDQADRAADFSAFVDWGDGSMSVGNVSGSNGVFQILATHTYTVPGAYSALVTLSAPEGLSIPVTDTVSVANSDQSGNTLSFSGSLASVGNGPNASVGYTNTNQPTLAGTAPPFATVMIYARLAHVDTVLSLGEAVTDGSGRWTLTVGPLEHGSYLFTATVTPAGGAPSGLMSLTANNGRIFVDMAPKKGKTRLRILSKAADAPHARSKVERLFKHVQTLRDRAKHRES